VVILLGLGSNLGERLINLRLAVACLKARREFTVSRYSSVYQTKPLGFAKQGDFYNAVIAARTTLSPLQLLKSIKEIESLLGRKRSRRWGPRCIDIDILHYGTRVVSLNKLTIPHAELYNRAFWLAGISEILGNRRDFMTGMSWNDMAKKSGALLGQRYKKKYGPEYLYE
jgi:2-amino-4-hydroxy-6-hydroxymethyldihydropteridine diphosphokinase